MRAPTLEQRAILDNISGARIRVVRAAPGSGKTTLIGMLIRKELESRPLNGAGIAALSFTRVGGQEIRREVGYDLSHPHFVGTIDAFLFRYVIRPFLKLVHPTWAAPRLLPADWSPNHWGKAPGGAPWDYRGSGGARAKSYNLFDVCFIDEEANKPILAYRHPYTSNVEPVSALDRTGLFNAKRQSWERFGWITHADAALLASELLGDASHGRALRSLVLRRFPLLIIDELQDTGLFLGKCLRLLLDDPVARGVLVGDPNQAIYEFNGARPDLFNGFETIPGATSMVLGGSQRCPITVVAAASHVKESSDIFTPAIGNVGSTFLIRYSDMVADVPLLVQSVQSRKPTAVLKVIARQSKTVEELSARSITDAKSLHCSALHHVYRAVKAFRQGLNARGYSKARAALEVATFGHEGVTDESLVEHRIDPRSWKSTAVRILMKSDALATTTSLYDWQMATGKIVDDEVSAFGLPISLSFEAGRLKPQKWPGWDKPTANFLPTGTISNLVVSGVPVQTVHAVKGETHDVTVFVCPDLTTARCPSTVWWSSDPKHLEERRIAFVAMTRTRDDLLVCVSESCYQRLCRTQAAFVSSFQCLTVAEFAARI
jgi:DNA helicase-2/ATP-dependent DNA helicase PcrA